MLQLNSVALGKYAFWQLEVGGMPAEPSICRKGKNVRVLCGDPSAHRWILPGPL